MAGSGKFTDPQPGVSGGVSKIVVDKDIVLRVAALFQNEADRMRKRVGLHASRMRTEPAMGDPVSRDVAAVLNHKLVDAPASYINRASGYVRELQIAANQLKETAKTYGFTDEDIATALTKYVPSPPTTGRVSGMGMMDA